MKSYKGEKKKKFNATATWTAVPNPLFYCECPNCKEIIMMSMPTTIDLLKKWARQFIKRK